MNRLKLEHIIRAAGSIADDKELIVLGSTSIFAEFPDISDEFLPSVEADVFPRNKPFMSQIFTTQWPCTTPKQRKNMKALFSTTNNTNHANEQRFLYPA
ncbi:MAG TPA: hypothetical protein HPP58_01395 [Deltaproteobacteria bacterium]|nr:hypothetical protein [Deltaproteobacteria bacterium]HIJ35974.1 hypothetical protein [Deltaproteobacteria bacterium]HIJ39593.1 hypothetical protein [Deltaproteobacteria bacterium]